MQALMGSSVVQGQKVGRQAGRGINWSKLASIFPALSLRATASKMKTDPGRMTMPKSKTLPAFGTKH